MLSKLLKYELKATGRIMVPLFAVLIVASGALAWDIMWENGEVSSAPVLSLILILVFFAAVLVTSVMSIALILMRFHKNLLGNEGYLMFSLPVTTAQNIASKVITALIWLIVGGAVGIGCGMVFIQVMGESKDFYTQLNNVWTIVRNFYGPGKAVFLLIFAAVTFLLGVLESIVQVYAAISLGHQWGNHRVIGSVLAYGGFAVVESLIGNLLRKAGFPLLQEVSIAQEEISTASNPLSAYAGLSTFLTKVAVPILQNMFWVTLCGIAVYWFITWFFLDKRLNLE